MKNDVPVGLEDEGLKLWKSIADGGFILRPDEVKTLEEACRTADLIKRLDDDLKGMSSMVDGIRPGMKVTNPLLTELRMQRTSLNSMLKSLKLPDDSDGERQKDLWQEQHARKMAQARWQGVRSQ